MTKHTFYSIRTGSNPAKDGFALDDLKELFQRVYVNLSEAGYFYESFGFQLLEQNVGQRKLNLIRIQFSPSDVF